MKKFFYLLILSFAFITASYSQYHLVGVDTICGATNVDLLAINDTTTLQWQRWVGNSFVDEVGADSTFYSVYLDSTTTFRVVSFNSVFSDTLTVYHFPKPSIPSKQNATYRGCGQNNSVTLRASTTHLNSIINWYENDTSLTIIQTGDSIEILSNTTTFPYSVSKSVYATAYNTLTGCESDRVIVTATFQIYDDYPQLNLGADTTVCLFPTSLTLDAKPDSSRSNFSRYSWNKGTYIRHLKPQLNNDSLYIVSVTNRYDCTTIDSIVVEIDSCIGKGSNYYYLYENFDHGIPSTWTNTAVSGAFDWMHGKMDDSTFSVYNASFNGTPMVYFNDDSLGYINIGSTHNDNTVELLSPLLNPLVNKTLILEFDYNFARFNNSTNYFKVEVFDGSLWITVLYVDANDCGRWYCQPPHALINLTSYINDQLQIKFTYHDGNNWAYWAAFDNVELYNPVPYYPIGDINTINANGIADSLNNEYWTTGTVAGVNLDSSGLNFTLIGQENSSPEGINIFSTSPTINYLVKEGDSINVIGLLSQTNGLQQIQPDSIFILDTTKNLPAYQTVTNLNESIESQMVKLENMKVISIGSGSSYDVGLYNGLDTLTMHIDEETNVDDSLSFTVGEEFCAIYGIGGQNDLTPPFTSDYHITPMHFEELTFSPAMNLGADTIVCDTATFQLTADTGFVSFLWNTGDTTQSIQPSNINDSLYSLTAINRDGCSVTDSIIVQIDICTGIDKIKAIENLQIQPNPSKGIFYVSGENQESIEIEIISSAGKRIKSIVINERGSINETIDLSGYAKGIYFIKFISENGMEVRKMVMQ